MLEEMSEPTLLIQQWPKKGHFFFNFIIWGVLNWKKCGFVGKDGSLSWTKILCLSWVLETMKPSFTVFLIKQEFCFSLSGYHRRERPIIR